MDKKIPEEKKDATTLRMERCKPVVKTILKEFLNNDLLLSDKAYVQQKVQEQIEAAFKNIVIEHFNEIFDTIYRSLQMTIKQAEDILWDKDTDELKYTDIDKLFAKNPEKAKEGLSKKQE